MRRGADTVGAPLKMAQSALVITVKTLTLGLHYGTDCPIVKNDSMRFPSIGQAKNKHVEFKAKGLNPKFCVRSTAPPPPSSQCGSHPLCGRHLSPSPAAEQCCCSKIQRRQSLQECCLQEHFRDYMGKVSNYGCNNHSHSNSINYKSKLNRRSKRWVQL